MSGFEPPALNVDIGEGFPFDEELILRCDWLNVACAAHAGSWEIASATIARGLDLGRVIGAHPGYPDRAGFGRAPLAGLDLGEVRISLIGQIGHVLTLTEVAYLKPHGSFYNESQDGGDAQELLIELLTEYPLPLLGLPGTGHEAAALRCGVPFLSEGFADRRYEAGKLVPRSRPDAMLTTRAELQDQVRRLASEVDSICIPGDAEGCVERADWVAEALR
jgi:5-oxoprolinase (ATP-hydrolysing) subunit A